MRQQAFAGATAPRTQPRVLGQAPVTEIFGSNVFGDDVMRRCLDAAQRRKLRIAAERGLALDPETAEAVASGLCAWALAHGATHYAHVFYPLNGQTAEKHESLFAPGPDGRLAPLFTGRCLVSGEPDASSLPSGGLRTTFEARGITAWDMRCPPYLVDNPDDPHDVVLAIPSTFASAAGDALDEKTPLARSGRALAAQAARVLGWLGLADEGPVHVNAGVEQEFFLIDRHFALARPDLSICGRTLLGARPPKGQEFEDQYFGAIPARVKAYMLDIERALWRLGIPTQTRHNEVAPGQYEFVPYFERDYLACDHQQIVMQVMQSLAAKHGFACLLHEKPFAGVNGSGKHVNWSVHTARRNLFKGGPDPERNLPFLLFTGAVLRAVHRFAPLLRAVAGGAGNDLRLGAHEAPPAILSVFLGESLEAVFEQLAHGRSHRPRTAHDDRNRTSPFAYTGNKFEFRSVGASQQVASALTVLNTALAEALDRLAEHLEATGVPETDVAGREQAARKVLGEWYREHEAVVFNGDGYSESWRREARRRGLPEITDSVTAFAGYDAPEHVALFERHGVMSAREIRGRAEIYLDRYVKQLATESAVCLAMAEQQVLPAAHRHQAELADTAGAMRQAGVEPHVGHLRKATSLTRALEDALDRLRQAIGERESLSELRQQAIHCRDAVLPAMQDVRCAADAIETAVADDLWPLPAYREMLFVR